MKRSIARLLAVALAAAIAFTGAIARAAADDTKITLLYDAFGTDPAIKKD